MSSNVVKTIFVACLLGLVVGEGDKNVKYEYKYSFKGPNLSQPDKTIPFWNTSGDAVPGADSLRVVPSLRGKSGAAWSKYPFTYDGFNVEVHFRILGRGKVGADGLAIWFVETPSQLGPVFGSMDHWKGMGIFFDSFDNDGKKNNPYVSIVINDGSISYDHSTDGWSQKNGGCLRDFRNRPYPVKAKISYIDNTLELSLHSGNFKEDDYEICSTIPNVHLPKNGYFGVSAATGGLADDHDVHKFLVWSVQSKEEVPEQPKEELGSDELKRIQEEYEENLRAFEQEQQKFREEHPDKVKEDGHYQAEEVQFEEDNELRTIFDIQSQLKQEISTLTSSMVMVLEKQDRIISRLDEKSPPDMELAKSHEIENVQKIQRTTFDSVVELQNHLNFLKSTLLTVSDNVAQINVGGRGGGGADAANIASRSYEQQKGMLDLKDRVDLVLNGLASIEAKQGKQPQLTCPTPPEPSCVSIVGLVVVAVVQITILLAYHMMRHSREAAAKKFF